MIDAAAAGIYFAHPRPRPRSRREECVWGLSHHPFGATPMRRFALLSAALLFLPVAALADDEDARRAAQEALDKGSALFDARDAAALAATYTTDAEICVVTQDKDSRGYKTQTVRGRQAIQKGYQDLFKDAQSR